MPPNLPSERTSSLFSGSRTEPANFVSPDLVLVQTPGWGIKTMPLSLATLAAFVRSKGHRVLPLDLNVEFHLRRRPPYMDLWDDNTADWFWRTGSRIEGFIADHRELIDAQVEALLATGARLFGFSCYSSCSHVSLHYAREIKRRRPDAVTIFGGPHASRTLAGRDLALRPGVDLVAQGEGELILLETVERVKAGRGVDGIPGTLQGRDGKVVDHGDRPLIRDLDELPFADLGDFDPSLYERKTTLPVMASRGCPNKCNYCSEKVYWGTYRGFSPRRVADEVFHQLERFPQLDQVDFMDSLINGVMSRMLDMARLFAAHPRKFIWASQAVIRKEMTYEVFKTLHDGGCRCLAFGLETSSVELMLKSGKVLAKGVELDRLVEDAHRAGLSCAYNFMFGLPGETAANAAASLDFLRRHKGRIGTVNPSAAFCGFSPGTPAFERPEDFGVVPDDSGREAYWRTADGTNDLLVRLERFEAFCAEAVDLGVPTTYPHRRLLDRDRVIADFLHHHGRHAEALPYYDRWLESHPDDETSRLSRRLSAHEARGRLARFSERMTKTLLDGARALVS
ncbi:MAG: radical SAM protein [Elusimicrobiota bacterium]|nr:radical SAM protein [Elusimicrobiota bacterium]